MDLPMEPKSTGSGYNDDVIGLPDEEFNGEKSSYPDEMV